MPALAVPLPDSQRNRFRKLRHLQAKSLVGIEHKGTTIEDQLILPANLIGVEHRKFGFDNLFQNNLIAAFDLGAVIRRAVWHQEKFSAAFS